MKLEINTGKALEYLLFREYQVEFESIDGSWSLHPKGLNFYEWLHKKGIITKEHMNRQMDNTVDVDFED